jgi:hypothetical protein
MSLDITRENAVIAISLACDALGWVICIPDAGLHSMEDEIHGIVIGRTEYVSYVVACLPVPRSTKH